VALPFGGCRTVRRLIFEVTMFEMRTLPNAAAALAELTDVEERCSAMSPTG